MHQPKALRYSEVAMNAAESLLPLDITSSLYELEIAFFCHLYCFEGNEICTS